MLKAPSWLPPLHCPGLLGRTLLFCWPGPPSQHTHAELEVRSLSRSLSLSPSPALLLTRYNDLMLGFTCIFADYPPGSPYPLLLADAMARLPGEEERVGEATSLRQRERGSLGAMGAGQWTGQFRTRPHALLDVRGLSSVEEWEKSLPRGCRRTLAKAMDRSFTVVGKPIRGGEPAPHSTLAHFRCVAEHEVRLLADTPTEVLDALSQAVGRYVGCTSQAGEIREYRDADGKVLAFAHEATKGRVMRGQWFYSTDEAAKNYVWFHSVRDLVRRAIEAEGVDMVDLGPSGTDAFSKLKSKYGFASVDDWHTVADYRGPFRYDGGRPAGESWEKSSVSWTELDPPDWLFEEGLLAQVRKRASGL